MSAALSVTSDIALCEGLICSGDRFITDRVALEGIKENFPEGLARRYGKRSDRTGVSYVCDTFLSCRIISDTPGQVENRFAISGFLDSCA